MKIHTYNIESEKTPEEQITRENEIMSKIFLEILLKYSDKKSKSSPRKTDEEITEILNRPDWREKNQFEVGDYKGGEYLGHWWCIPWLISAREPIEIIERLKKELEEAVKEKETYFKISADYYTELIEKKVENEELKSDNEELTKVKNKYGSLEKVITEFLLTYYKEEEEGKNDWSYWNIKELKGLISKVKGELNETVIKIIEKWEQDAKSHSEAVDKAEEWKNQKVAGLNKEIVDKSELLQTSNDMVKTQRERIQELEKDLEEKSELLKEANRIIKEQKTKAYLDTNRLSKFKALKEKTKTKFQQFKEKIKHQSQELIARIEIKVK